MKLLKVANINNISVLINIDKVLLFEDMKNGQTMVYFNDSENNMIIKASIEQIGDILLSYDETTINGNYKPM